MRMYVWHNVLRDWTPGMVCVHAKDKRSALAQIKREYGDGAVYNECSRSPVKSYSGPHVAVVSGGG